MLNLDLWKLLLDLKSIASDILRYIFEPAEWIRYIAIYFNLPSEYDTWPADKPPIYLQKSFISMVDLHVSLLVQHHIISVLCDHCQLYDLLNQLLVDLLYHLGHLLVNYPIHHHLKLDLFYLREVKFH